MARPSRRPAADQPALLDPDQTLLPDAERSAPLMSRDESTRIAGEETVRSDVPSAGGPRVVVRRSARRKRTVTAYRDADAIVVLIPQRMTKADERVYVEDMVAKVLARESRSSAPRGDAALAERAKELSERYLAPQLGYAPEPASVTWVTNQNHRWGSCTPSSATIRLSHRMMPMPSWVVDYVLLHELAHLAESGHTRRFWRLVNVYPDADKAQGYLEGFQAGSSLGRDTDERSLSGSRS
ncbi:MAG TPA: M48 family metallopeptidase [Microlunatus sp.]